MPCNGTTWVGTLTDDAGTIHVVFCDACRTIAVDAWDGHRQSWGITHVDPKALRPTAAVRREPRILERLRGWLAHLQVSRPS